MSVKAALPTRKAPRQVTWWKVLLICLPFVAVMAQAISGFDRLKMVLLTIAPLMAAIFLNVELGVYVLLGFSTVVVFIKRLMPNLDANQIGLALEGMLVLMGLRLVLDLANGGNPRLFRTAITLPLLVFCAYQVLEVLNPLAPSIKFGLYGLRDTLRAVGALLVVYYFRSEHKLKRFMVFWLGLLTFEGLYGIFQHHHGLLNQEYNWLIESGSWRTHILNGYVRVFGTVGDAATFGFIEITGALLLFALALSSKGWRVIALLALAAPMLYAMVLSYSRGPIVAVAAGLGAMLLLSRNWKLTMGAMLIGTLCLGGLAAAGQTRLLDRVMTATKPGEDASFQVRMGYINDYLPRIVERPFGSGLWTAGASGLAVTGGEPIPGTTIGVPTDNNYFKYGLEMGWVGLTLFIWLIVATAVSAARTYTRLSRPFPKALSLGLFGVFVCYAVGALSNDIYVQKPLSEWFYLAIGLAMLLGQSAELQRRSPPRRPL
ncbi:O-antigen ligase family protein [bacterium]|nr:O-antigen ligase family protein [bacterium]